MLYDPKTHYIPKDGFFRGKCLDLMMFYNYREMLWHLERESYNSKSSLLRHIDWLIKRGESRLPKLVCPICKKRKVVFFRVDYNFNNCYGSDFEVDSKKVCCDQLTCKNKNLNSLSSGSRELKKPLFSEILNLAILPEDEKKIGDLYKEIYMLPSKLSHQDAFSFFKN